MRSKLNLLRPDCILGFSFLIIGLTAPFSLIPIKLQQICGLLSFAIIFWLFQPIKIEKTSILLIAAFIGTELTEVKDILLTFSSDAPWLIVAGMAISLAMIELNIANLIALNIRKSLSKSLPGLVIQMHLLGLFTALIVPSGLVRVIILIPLGKAISVQYCKKQQFELQNIILLSLTLSTVLGGFGILTGAVPNMIAAGLYTVETNISVSWANWLLWMFPSAGLVRIIISTIIISIIFSGKFKVLTKNKNYEKKSFDRNQILFFGIIASFVVGLITDSVHNFSPLQICIFTVIIIFSRPIGPLPFKAIRNVQFSFLFYVVALFSLGHAVETSGLIYYYKKFIFDLFDFSKTSLPLGYVFTASSPILLSVFMDVAAVAAILVPIYVESALSIGLDAYPAMMSICLGTSIVFLPYQAAPLMLAYSSGELSKRLFLKVLSLVAVFSLTVLYPFTIYLWFYFGLI
jgi:di/tricarboxylate transporter